MTTTPNDVARARRPDPVEVRARCLEHAWRVSAVYSVLLGALALGAPRWTGGDVNAALLPGVPGFLVGGLFLLGRAPDRRRVCMALTTAIAGALALATAGSLGAIGGELTAAVGFQVAVFGLSSLMVAVTGPAWRRVNARGEEAERELRMYDEL